MSRLLSIVPTETETTSIVLNGPIEGHLIIFHQTKVKFIKLFYSHNRRQHPIWSKTQSSLRQVEAQVIIITIFVIIISITSIHNHHHHQTL